MNNNDISKKNKIIYDKLLSYQIDHVKNLNYIINKNKSVLDSSDTGTGKTYTSIALCAILNLKPIIICPKSVINNWRIVCEYFNVKYLLIVNYETIKIGKYYSNGNRINCPFIKLLNKESNKKTINEESNKESNKRTINEESNKELEKDNNLEYKWIINEDNIFIFDEVHKCSEINTQNGKLLYSTKQTNNKIILLSATIADNPNKFKLFFYILNFIDPKQVEQQNMTFSKYQSIMYNWIIRDKNPMLRINSMLYPDRASRMKIDVLGDLFPETQIIAMPYTIEYKRQKQIENEYKNIQNLLNDLKDIKNKDKSNILTKILRSRQKIEIIKIPLFVELTNDFLENNYSVVIFVNFTKTLEELCLMLHTNCTIEGSQTKEQRDKNIEDFQNNKEKIIICNIKAGSVGVSLHDIHGGHPRVSLISPTWNSIDLVQSLGRIHRANGKSKSLQRIIYTANTIEEKIADKLQKKLKDLNRLNNGDVDLTNITFDYTLRKI